MLFYSSALAGAYYGLLAACDAVTLPQACFRITVGLVVGMSPHVSVPALLLFGSAVHLLRPRA